MKKLMALFTAFALLAVNIPVLANEEAPQVCVLEYNEDGIVKNEEEYQKCLESLETKIDPLEGKYDPPKG